MGLDFGKQVVEPYDFGWSYGGFHSFRKRLAKEIGIELDKMEGFAEMLQAQSWDTVSEPIKLLLHHSDCDGALSFRECEEIYPELLRLIEKWQDDDYDKITATKLANAMKECAADENKLIFC